MTSQMQTTEVSEKKEENLYRPEYETNSKTSVEKTDLLGLESIDPVLSAKMHLVNNVCLRPLS
jgi:hypothetical protein